MTRYAWFGIAAGLWMSGCAGPEDVQASGPADIGETNASTTDDTTPVDPTPDSQGVTSSVPTESESNTMPPDTMPPDTSDPECGGCINSQGICESGHFDTACGLGGAACEPCEAPTQCAEGVCLAPPGCGPDNCQGCCEGDTCITNIDESNCGSGGQECTACESDATCEDGTCELPCELICDGCCTLDDECIEEEDQDIDACGFLGFQCELCELDELCSFGICLSEACSQSCQNGCCDGDTCLDGLSDNACGFLGASCTSCSDGAGCNGVNCDPDEGVQWQVTLLDGEVAPLDPDGLAWDAFGGAPDPYVIIEALDAQSGFASNTAFPVWNETLSGAVLTDVLQTEFEVRVLDDDIAVDETIGSCMVSIPDEDFGGVSEVTCSVDGAFVWELALSITTVQK